MMENNHRQSRISAWEILILVAVVLIGYAPSLFNGFVCDDEIYVLTNPLVTGPFDLKKILTEPYPPGRPEQGLYRPLVTLSYVFGRQVWGLGSGGKLGFHLTNNLLHALNVLLFLCLLRRLGLDRWPCFFSCLIFACHPALCEAVAWVSGRAELLGTTFGLLSLLLFFREPCGMKKGAPLFLWLLAMLCKEHWIMLPALAAALAVCRPATVSLERPAWTRAIVLAGIVGIAFWAARSLAVGSWRPELTAYTGVVSTGTRVTTALLVLWKYIGLWLWPVHLSIHHDIQPLSGGIWTIIMASTWVFVFWAAWRLRFRSPWPLLALSWFWLASLPVSNVILPVGAVFGERFLYAPTMFFAPVVILIIRMLLRRAVAVEYRPLFSIALGIVVAALFVTRTWVRLSDWHSNLTVWEAAAECYPQSLAIKAPLAEVLLKEGRFAEAHKLAREAVDQLEHQPRIYRKLLEPQLRLVDAAAQAAMSRLAWFRKFNEANQTAQSFRLREALKMYRELMRNYPEIPETFEAAGDVYVRMENLVAARQHFETALRMGGSTPDLFAKYGTVMSKLGYKAEALMAYDQSLRGNPTNPLVCHNRGMVLADLGDYSEALEAFQQASKLAPPMVEPRLNAAALLIHFKRYDEAERELAQVLALNPRQEQANELLKRLARARGSAKPPKK